MRTMSPWLAVWSMDQMSLFVDQTRRQEDKLYKCLINSRKWQKFESSTSRFFWGAGGGKKATQPPAVCFRTTPSLLQCSPHPPAPPSSQRTPRGDHRAQRRSPCAAADEEGEAGERVTLASAAVDCAAALAVDPGCEQAREGLARLRPR